jgi:hypothetical protein
MSQILYKQRHPQLSHLKKPYSVCSCTWKAEMRGNKMNLTSPLQILSSFLSGGGYLPINSSKKFCEELSFVSFGYKLNTTLEAIVQEFFCRNMVAFREGLNCHMKEKQLNSVLRHKNTATRI